jgi:hypothetical protein
LDDGTTWNEDVDPFSVTSEGTSKVLFYSVDRAGNYEEMKEQEIKIDKAAPKITSIISAPNHLWPPNHQLIPVSLSVQASDTADPNPTCKITSISANLPENPKTKLGKLVDWEITGDLTAKLRSEYPAILWYKGRIYTLEVTCTDAAGNSSTGIERIGVGNHWNWRWRALFHMYR